MRPSPKLDDFGGPRFAELVEPQRVLNAAIAKTLWITDGAVVREALLVFSKRRIPGAPDTHRRVLGVLTFLEAR